MKKFFQFVFLFLILFYTVVYPVQSYANAATASKLAVAVGKTLLTKMKNQGFAANDPRFGPTLAASGVTLSDVATTAAGAGGGALLGAVGAPVWLTLAASLAIGTGLQLAMEYGMPNLPPPVATGASNPSLQVSAASGFPSFTYTTTVTNPNPDTTPQGLIFSPDQYFFGSPQGYSSIQGYVDYINSLPKSSSPFVWVNVVSGPMNYSYNSGNGSVSVWASLFYDQIFCRSDVVQDVKPNCTGDVSHGSMTYAHGSQPATCPSGTSWNNTSYACMPSATITTTTTKSGTPQDLANGSFTINDGINGSPLNPQIIANLANRAWQQAAATPGYTGVPYQMYDPVSSWDVAQAYSPQNNPYNDTYPTVQDALAPVSAPNTAISINLDPNPVTTTTSPSTVDLGPDPGIAAPVLEATPTAQQILSPILNLMPSLKSFVVPSHTAACPRPSATVWGKTVTLSGHCDLLETPGVRDALYAAMAVVWTMAALFIVLKA